MTKTVDRTSEDHFAELDRLTERVNNSRGLCEYKVFNYLGLDWHGEITASRIIR